MAGDFTQRAARALDLFKQAQAAAADVGWSLAIIPGGKPAPMPAKKSAKKKSGPPPSTTGNQKLVAGVMRSSPGTSWTVKAIEDAARRRKITLPKSSQKMIYRALMAMVHRKEATVISGAGKGAVASQYKLAAKTGK